MICKDCPNKEDTGLDYICKLTGYGVADSVAYGVRDEYCPMTEAENEG